MLHKKCIDFIKAPAYLGKKSLSHKLTQMQTSMNFSLLNEKVEEVRRGLHEMKYNLNNVVSQIQDHAVAILVLGEIDQIILPL